MIRSWRLTRQAEATLADIAEWTFATFGPHQAEAYEADLLARLDAIAGGAAPRQPCGVLCPTAVGEIKTVSDRTDLKEDFDPIQ